MNNALDLGLTVTVPKLTQGPTTLTDKRKFFSFYPLFRPGDKECPSLKMLFSFSTIGF